MRRFRHLANAIRQAVIAAQAAQLNVPACFTPAWQQTYSR